MTRLRSRACSRGRWVALVLALIPICLAIAIALGGSQARALAAGTSTAVTTTSPSLTRSFPLGHRRLDRSRPAGSRSAPGRHVQHSQTGSGTRPVRSAASVAPGPSTEEWILILLGAIVLTAAASYLLLRRVGARPARGGEVVETGGVGEVGEVVEAGEVGGAGGAREAVVAPGPSDGPPELGAVSFCLYRDGAGAYYWTIVDADGAELARSVGFASYPEANFAADIVHSGAATASFENRSGTSPPRRPLSSPDRATEQDPEEEPPAEPGPAPDQGTSVSREEVTRQARAIRSWPAGSSSSPGGRRR